MTKTFHSSLIAVALIALAAGCSSSSSTGGGDGGVSADASNGGGDSGQEAGASACGHPGDPGNSVGVGKYCTSFADCAGTPSAHICSIIGDSTTHFCTRTCTAPPDGGPDAASSDAGAGECGEGATCSCDNQGCGCTPNVCL